jgi:dephospho-CoA kinase
MGAGVLDADRAGHEVLCTAEVERAVRQRWGDGVFGPDGRVDRQRLAEIVFTPSKEGVEARKYLEQLTHPAIGERLREQAEQLQREGCAVIVLDAALLLEAGWDKLCDRSFSWIRLMTSGSLEHVGGAGARRSSAHGKRPRNRWNSSGGVPIV